MNLPTILLAKTAAGALAGTGLVTASVLGLHTGGTTTTATTATTPAAASTGQQACRPHGLHVRHAPEALRKDLLAARTKLHESGATGTAKRAERREARAHIHAGILAGTYGEEVQQRAEHREAAAAKRRAALPTRLRSDLDTLKAMQPGQDRRQAAARIRAGRLDGTYGATVQQHAQKHDQLRTQRKQACQDRRAQKKTHGARRSQHPGAARSDG